jgi:F-type H+-transporting ATPase subunit gamma
MPSLKDLKNRIASVKNTRKITKAMQMVVGGQTAPRAGSRRSRPPLCRTHDCGDGGLAPRSAPARTGAPRLLAGNGSDQVQLLVVMTSERGLCGGFNSTIVKLARAKANELAAGQDGQDPDRRQEGPRAAQARLGQAFVGHVDLSEVKRVGYANAQASRANSGGASSGEAMW